MDSTHNPHARAKWVIHRACKWVDSKGTESIKVTAKTATFSSSTTFRGYWAVQYEFVCTVLQPWPVLAKIVLLLQELLWVYSPLALPLIEKCRQVPTSFQQQKQQE